MTYDLREYFPDSKQSTFRKTDGSLQSRYTFTKANAGFDGLYNGYYSQGVPGYHYEWQKEYQVGGTFKTATYCILFMADDKKVTEVGDWLNIGYPNTDSYGLFGYKNQGTSVNTGLGWSDAGGLTLTPYVKEMDVWNQATSGAAYTYKGYQAYSKSGLIEHLDSFTPQFGRDSGGTWGEGRAQTYNDVLHIVMYHGTKNASTVPLRCNTPPLGAKGAYYQSFKNYNSYAIELWIAKDVGIIQERTTFVEDGSYWGVSNFNGDIFSAPNSWTSFIDNSPAA